MKQSFHLYLSLLVCFFIFSASQVYSATDLEKEINRLSKEIAKKISRAGKKKAAVANFTDLEGSVTDLGRFIAEEFSIALAAASKRFIVVDRVHLQSILKKHKLAPTGQIDQESALKLGKIAGVKAIVTGSLVPFGEKIRINIKVLDTKTAAIIDASRVNISMTRAIKSLMKKEVKVVKKPVATGKNENNPSKKVRVVEKDFVFEVVGCKRGDNKITCTMLITNTEKDRKLSIRFGNTSLYDNFGNEYPVQEIQIGDKIQKRGVFSIDKEIFSGVTTTIFLTFEDLLPRGAVKLAVVLKCSHSKLDSYNWKNFAVKLRNIPLSR